MKSTFSLVRKGLVPSPTPMAEFCWKTQGLPLNTSLTALNAQIHDSLWFNHNTDKAGPTRKCRLIVSCACKTVSVCQVMQFGLAAWLGPVICFIFSFILPPLPCLGTVGTMSTGKKKKIHDLKVEIHILFGKQSWGLKPQKQPLR